MPGATQNPSCVFVVRIDHVEDEGAFSRCFMGTAKTLDAAVSRAKTKIRSSASLPL